MGLLQPKIMKKWQNYATFLMLDKDFSGCSEITLTRYLIKISLATEVPGPVD